VRALRIYVQILKYSCQRMATLQNVEDGVGVLGCVTYFNFTQFAVYSGVTHDHQTPFTVSTLSTMHRWSRFSNFSSSSA